MAFGVFDCKQDMKLVFGPYRTRGEAEDVARSCNGGYKRNKWAAVCKMKVKGA